MDEQEFMYLCLAEARRALEEHEVPIGALIVMQGKVIARAHNVTRKTGRPTAHAEILAIEEAARVIGNSRLVGATLFTTKEPCIMCAGAIVEARIKRLVFGCFDERRGAFGSMIDVNALPVNHRVETIGGILKQECAALLRKFFEARRGTEVAITGPTRNRLYA